MHSMWLCLRQWGYLCWHHIKHESSCSVSPSEQTSSSHANVDQGHSPSCRSKLRVFFKRDCTDGLSQCTEDPGLCHYLFFCVCPGSGCGLEGSQSGPIPLLKPFPRCSSAIKARACSAFYAGVWIVSRAQLWQNGTAEREREERLYCGFVLDNTVVGCPHEQP